MNLPVNIFTWVSAALPVTLLLLLMIRFKWGAFKAAPAALVLAILVAFFIYKSGWALIGFEALKALWNALSILLVVWTAILIYEVTNEAGMLNTIRQSMEKITPNELLRILGVGMVFASFLQGVTGFGVPVAVTAPLLIGIGVRPMWAVIIPLIGHCWAGTFGTLAIAWQSLIMQTGLTDTVFINQAGFFAGIFLWIINFAAGIMICWFYGRKEAVKKGFQAVALISLVQGGGQLLLTQVNQTLACFIPGCAALIVLFLLSRSKGYNNNWCIKGSAVMESNFLNNSGTVKNDKQPSMHEAFLPYYIMTGITLLVLLVSPLKNLLESIIIGPSFPETVTGYGVVNPGTILYSPLKPLTHAGTFLFISAACGFLYYGKKSYITRDSGKRILKRIIKKTIPSSIAVIALIMMSRVMSGSGQTIVLASGMVGVVGVFCGVISPFTGILGSFMTGSNMSSNILFGNFQLATANLLHFNPAVILAAQTAGGAIGTSISPGNIILGTTTAGIIGEEGRVLKKVFPAAAALAFVFGVILVLAKLI